MADNTAPKLPLPPYFLMKSKYEFECIDSSGTMKQLRDHFSGRIDTVISWKLEEWNKFKLFVLRGEVYSSMIITLYHIDDTKNVIEVHRRSGYRMQYKVLNIIKKILSGDTISASAIQFVDNMKPLSLPNNFITELPLCSDESVKKKWTYMMNHFASPYVDHYLDTMKRILTFINDQTPHFVLTVLCKNFTTRTPPNNILNAQIIYLFLHYSEQWKKLSEGEKSEVNSFISETLASDTDESRLSSLSDLMLKKVASQFREKYPVTI